VIRPENQLAAGTPIAPPVPVVRAAPPVQQTVWEDDNWEEVQAMPAPLPQRLKAEPLYYDDEDEGENWNDTSRDQSRTPKVYQDVAYTPIDPPQQPLVEKHEDELVLDEDMWGEDTKSSQPQKLNIPEPLQKLDLPQTFKQVEYQEEVSE
jgi:hypothetical protein